MTTLGVMIVIGAVCGLLLAVGRVQEATEYIDRLLAKALGSGRRTVYMRTFPRFRFADLHRAVTQYSSERSGTTISSQHAAGLADILAGRFYNTVRKKTEPEQLSIATSHDREEFFTADGFWIMRPTPRAELVVLRVRQEPYTARVVLEVGASGEAEATAILDDLVERSKQLSIYRNKVIELLFGREVRDGSGEIAPGDIPEIVFLAPVKVARDDLVLPSKTRDVIERNIVSFHEHRKSLIAAGVPGKKGVLFFGPPGTGKTFTCKYLASRLDVTTVVASGHALLHIKSICNIARMLQPSLVILEDIDLVYTQRDINPFSTALGELMDEMDGFASLDEMTFILTTNELDRVESAIKDRPGRISQCIEFDCPDAELRASYLRALLASYQHDGVSMETLVRRSAGASQAFLKELVFRAIQFSLERSRVAPNKPGDVALATADFEHAFDEMTSGAGQAIVGFGKGR